MTGETSKIHPKKYLYRLLSDVAGKLYLEHKAAVLPTIEIMVPDSRFGDYSTNLALRLAQIIKLNPKDVAEKLSRQIQSLDAQKVFSSIEPAGGFINFKLSEDYLICNLQSIIDEADLYGCSIVGGGKTVVVEYFQNNVAKPPHVGHLRSAVVGDCLLRIMKSQGYKAVSDTHIGDWGTQFGILLYAFKTMGDKKTVEQNPIDELNKLYVAMSAKIETDPELQEKGKQEFLKLEQGDTENRELWQWFVRVSMEDFERYRQLLDVLPFDHNFGESFYEDKMPAVISDLKNKKLLVESEGAQVVNLEDKNLGFALVVKSDGATTYLTRDLATVKYRADVLKPSKVLYVVDNRQLYHFRQVFEVASQAGYIEDQNTFEHIDLGFMSLPEGAISTRKGTVISLQKLIDEAQSRALKIIDEKNPDLANKESVARLVGLAAIKYFDLSHNRKTEFTFTWETALSFEGNTGPYLQYTHARIQGIFRKFLSLIPKGQADFDSAPILNTITINDHELLVLRKLQKFPEILDQIVHDYLPNNLCNYLFELAQLFNAFYQEVPVLKEIDDQKRSFRLKLTTATAQVLRNGLYLLGIEAPEEM